MTAIDWGWSIEETAARLMEESIKAQENGHNYALTTARNAAAAVERRSSRTPNSRRSVPLIACRILDRDGRRP